MPITFDHQELYALESAAYEAGRELETVFRTGDEEKIAVAREKARAAEAKLKQKRGY